MRRVLLGVIAAIAIPAAGSAQAVITSTAYGVSALGGPTPTEQKIYLEKATRGAEFLRQNAKTPADTRAYARKCLRNVSQPDYCVISQIRRMAHHNLD